MEQQISEPTEDDIRQLARQILVVDELANVHLGRGVANDASDLELLQALLDAGVLSPDQTYELQCLGIVFGKQLVAALDGLDWAIVEDEYGRDPALRYLQTSLLLFPLTMISKRVEAHEAVDVRDLFEGLCAKIEELRGELGPS